MSTTAPTPDEPENDPDVNPRVVYEDYIPDIDFPIDYGDLGFDQAGNEEDIFNQGFNEGSLEHDQRAKDIELAKAATEAKREEIALKRETLENQRIEDELDARKSYANRVFALVAFWVAAILIAVFLQGCGTYVNEGQIGGHSWSYKYSNFVLSDNVLLALIGGTSASVIGLFVIVANHIFPKGAGKKLEEKAEAAKS